MLKLEKLRLKFPGDQELLFKDLSLQINEGEKVLLLGPSGCGKSTFLQVLSGIIPNSVEVPMKAESIKLPESWGYVFQDPDSQFCMPYADEEIAFVLENLQIPREEMRPQIRQLLTSVGLEFDDIHQNIHTLSGGMKQRLAIASVLALEPDVLFLDEPTALLDQEGTASIWNTVKKVSADKTLIVVEHKLEHVIDLIDRIILFDEKGEMIADGPKEQVLTLHKETMRTQGIWYPGVWNDYHSPEKVNPQDEEILHLEQFKGYRQKETKIEVENTIVKRGEWIAITGENGAGKSTLLYALMKFIKTSGTYELFSKKVKKLPEALTFVFQNPEFQFVTNSVYDEVAYSLRLQNRPEQELETRVEALLARFHLSSLDKHHPYQLSIGQKRRLSVAASIIRDQQVLLLDEPTFGQDSKNTFALLEMLHGLQQDGATILMVTHDNNIVDHFATRVWTIENGKLVDDQVVRSNEQEEVLECLL
ncbi:ABC transporter ATP-binding protein [Pseudalkalibacillus berkeleyi]|uniref:Energy-coupling factor ABC transporter ATP-binding protein n=1 Tax=Pseudalkalibacillus berkeleyi TaxID=1069813 RepID=A0ABS9H632_9BACL|nr:ABC transporter ATP-binding protein [Pseudalkalibacillus berkeleyi]MCF6139238.1 energy-coupling factor ABC transporter ATP-binding protein [Pseudalkalibacillus berkeleyi]